MRPTSNEQVAESVDVLCDGVGSDAAHEQVVDDSPMMFFHGDADLLGNLLG